MSSNLSGEHSATAVRMEEKARHLLPRRCCCCCNVDEVAAGGEPRSLVSAGHACYNRAPPTLELAGPEEDRDNFAKDKHL